VPPVNLTCNSLIAENLDIAAGSPLSTSAIVEKIFHKIAEIVDREGDTDKTRNDGDDAREPDDFYLYDVACDLVEGNLDERRIGLLKKGFDALLSELE